MSFSLQFRVHRCKLATQEGNHFKRVVTIFSLNRKYLKKQIRQKRGHHLSLQKLPHLLCLNFRPNDRNISTKHIATLLGATLCVRLATLLRRVATCWVLLAEI